MEAFVGTGFDCEFLFNTSPISIGHLLEYTDEYSKPHFKYFDDYSMDYDACRPRLNKPQVLDKYDESKYTGPYDFVKDVDGAVWDIFYGSYNGNHREFNVTSKDLFGIVDLIWLAYKGQQAGLGYDEWCKAHGVPILEVG